MSYDIDLVDENGNTIILDEKHNLTGGTYRAGGNNELTLNITYGYSWFFYRFIDQEKGIRYIYGMKGKDAIPILEKAINDIGPKLKPFTDYWAPTPGNTVKVLKNLIKLAQLAPEGVFKGD